MGRGRSAEAGSQTDGNSIGETHIDVERGGRKVIGASCWKILTKDRKILQSNLQGRERGAPAIYVELDLEHDESQPQGAAQERPSFLHPPMTRTSERTGAIGPKGSTRSLDKKWDPDAPKTLEHAAEERHAERSAS